MRITVNVYAHLRHYIQHAEDLTRLKTWEVPEGTSVGQILSRLKLPKEVSVSVLVNSNSVKQDTILNEGDTVHILPQMGGG
jgi:sulfur-carrier protein